MLSPGMLTTQSPIRASTVLLFSNVATRLLRLLTEHFTSHACLRNKIRAGTAMWQAHAPSVPLVLSGTVAVSISCRPMIKWQFFI